MTWQDAVIFVGQMVMSLSLIPAMRSKMKPPLATSIPTAFFMFAFGVTFLSLGLYLSAATSAIGGTAWTILAVQMRRKAVLADREFDFRCWERWDIESRFG